MKPKIDKEHPTSCDLDCPCFLMPELYNLEVFPEVPHLNLILDVKCNHFDEKLWIAYNKIDGIINLIIPRCDSCLRTISPTRAEIAELNKDNELKSMLIYT